MPTKTKITKEQKLFAQWQELNKMFAARSVLKANPAAFEFIRFEEIPLTAIAPESINEHNGVRAHGIDQQKVNEWAAYIESGDYDPIKFEPPVVTELAPNDPLRKDGYRFRQVDGHHRVLGHIQIGLETIRVQVGKFHAVDGKSAEYWRIVFMAEANDRRHKKFLYLESSVDDKKKTAQLLLAESNIVVETGKELSTEQMRMNEAKAAALEIIKELGITKKSERTEMFEMLMGELAENNTNIRKLIVRSYTDKKMANQLNMLCKKKRFTPENAVTRTFYVNDPFCSRFDYDQIVKLLNIGMQDPAALKRMYILGQVTKAKGGAMLTVDHVVRERKRKMNHMVDEFAAFIHRTAEWLSNEKNRAAIANVPFYWTPQVFDDGEDGPFQIDPKTGNRK